MSNDDLSVPIQSVLVFDWVELGGLGNIIRGRPKSAINWDLQLGPSTGLCVAVQTRARSLGDWTVVHLAVVGAKKKTVAKLTARFQALRPTGLILFTLKDLEFGPVDWAHPEKFKEMLFQVHHDEPAQKVEIRLPVTIDDSGLSSAFGSVSFSPPAKLSKRGFLEDICQVVQIEMEDPLKDYQRDWEEPDQI